MRSDHGEITQTITSGSTGTPVVTLGTTLTRMMWSACTLRQHLWAKRDLSGKLAAIRACRQEREPDTDNWGLGTLEIARTGPATTLSIQTDVQTQADWLIEQEPDYLLTYPSVVAALIDHFRHTGLRLRRLREVRTFGEVLDPQVREQCRQHWNVPVTDVYSTQEIGYVAIQCPEVEQHITFKPKTFWSRYWTIRAILVSPAKWGASSLRPCRTLPCHCCVTRSAIMRR